LSTSKPRPNALDLKCVNDGTHTDSEDGESTPPNDVPTLSRSGSSSNEIMVEIQTKCGERCGLDLAAKVVGLSASGVEVRTNTIGVKAGSRLLSINGSDMRKATPHEASAMLHEADGVVELVFAAPSPSRPSSARKNANGRISLLGRLTGARTPRSGSSLLGDDASLLE